MKAKTTNAGKSSLPIIQRGNRFILQKTFNGKQRQHALGENYKDAVSRCLRFLQTAETDSYEKAVEELTGKKVLKKGDDPTLKQMEELYREFCNQSAKPPRPDTIDHNLARLEVIMRRAGVTTIGQIDKKKLFNSWFKEDAVTPSQKRTFASAIKAAQSVFKKSALEYYTEHKGLNIENPFKGLELAAPRVAQFIPPANDVLEGIFNTYEKELSPSNAMIMLLSFCGLRRAEIEAIKPENFSKQTDNVLLSIHESGEFQPKANQDGYVPIPHSTYDQLLKLRAKCEDSKFFIPSNSKKEGKGRLWVKVTEVNEWLKGKGLKNKPSYSARKIAGSVVAKEQGIIAAAKVLRNTPEVAMKNYLGVTSVSAVDVQGSLKQKTPEELLAEKMGISLEELKKRLGV